MTTEPKPSVVDAVTNFVTGAANTAPLKIKVAAWLITVAGLLVFAVLMRLDQQRYGGDHLAVLTGLGIALLGIRGAVVSKWQR